MVRTTSDEQISRTFQLSNLQFSRSKIHLINRHYYINTNEIPGELWLENLISSHVKISPLLWLHNKSRLSHQKNYQSKMVWYFIGVYIINRTLHGRLAALTLQIFINTRREISYLQAAM